MGKFGKKNHVSLNPLDCSIIFMGSPKIGKTRLMKEVAEKLVGENGYIFLEMFREVGASKIENIVYEDVETWSKFEEIVSDIEENKATDYPELRTIFMDTWDNAILLAEKEAIRIYNKENPDNKKKTISEIYGGWQRGQDKAGDLLDDMIFRLEQVGVKVSIIMHLKSKSIVDAVTEKEFQQVTADVTQKYFGRIKRNADVIAVGYVDRTIVTENTGKKDIKGRDITKDVVKEEARKIKFRDNGYTIDAGGRLKYIVEEIPFEADAFINAIQDALEKEVEEAGVSLADRKKEDKKRAKEAEKIALENSSKAKNNKIDEEKNEELIEIIKTNYSEVDDEVKAEVKDIMAKYNIPNFKTTEVSTKGLEEIVSLLQ